MYTVLQRYFLPIHSTISCSIFLSSSILTCGVSVDESSVDEGAPLFYELLLNLQNGNEALVGILPENLLYLIADRLLCVVSVGLRWSDGAEGRQG